MSLVLSFTAIATSCTLKESINEPGNEPKLPSGEFIRLSLCGGDGSKALPSESTRAAWDDPNGKGNLSFKWETVDISSPETNKLALIVSDGTNAISSHESELGTDNTGIKHTGLAVTPNKTDAHYADFETVRYYSTDDLNNAKYFYAVAGAVEITADAQVDILATNSAMAFDGFKLKENANGWVKGRFINRNMADAMNAIGVTPVYSVVKTYKPASKEDFYNTYLKAAYDSANETQKAKFDEQWTLFGTQSAIGNDSAYKAMYSKTFRLADGEETMEVIVPGNTSSNQSRNIIVVVRSADIPITSAPTSSAFEINASGDTSVPRSKISNPAPLSMTATRFLPIS